MKVLFLALVALTFLSCQAEIKFSSDIIDNNEEIINCQLEKKWSWQGEIDNSGFSVEYISNFEQRWINGRSQWIPTEFQFDYMAMSKLDFGLVPYTPEISFKNNDENWIEYTLTYKVEIGSAVVSPFLFAGPLEYDFCKYKIKLDSLDGQKVKADKFSTLDYENLSDNSIIITKTYKCINTENGLEIEYQNDTEGSIMKLESLNGIGNCSIEEKSNFTNIIPRIDKVHGVIHKSLSTSKTQESFQTYLLTLEEWNNLNK